ncbi:MAG: thioredoxin domain-containing protein [Opitutaceae bacterium]|nr:thioredoxin domain-containing protein [Opitutaceae bacterium]
MRRFPSLAAGLIAFASLVPVSALAGPLTEAPSAYVRAHDTSPVKFLPWGEAAWARAKAEQKPLYVVVGSFTQELARAMREQSFAREENAALLNEGFIPVVVDRDEHPDLAAFLQAYVNTVKQMQGWPLNVWLTPELKPFEGASYLPPSDEWGKEGFPNALKRVLNAWQTDPEAQRAKADEAIAALTAAVPTEPPAPVDAVAVNSLLDDATAAWLAAYDATNGGFGEPPRRLEPELLRFLLRREDKASRDAALATIRAVLASPVRDPLDGGFFRSAGDTAWRQPTLQKVLSDQARAALACFAADLPAVADGALGFGESLRPPMQGCMASLDGTAESCVPAFLWTVAEVREVVGADAADRVAALLGLADAGNLPPDSYLGIDTTGKNLPRWTQEAADESIRDAVLKLRVAREQRTRPARDSEATSGAHGLMVAALAKSAHKPLQVAAAQIVAEIEASFIRRDGTLRAARIYATEAAPRDYALLADGLLAYASVSGDADARRLALALVARCNAVFWNAAAGRYMAAPVTLPAGIGARVVAPAPDAGDLPSAESAMLLLLSTHRVGEPAHRAALAAAIAAEVREAGTPARGDQLLALQAWVTTLK